MRTFILTSLLAFGFGFKFSDKQQGSIELKWENWNNGYPKAISSGKIALIDVYTDWCYWCKVMDKNTYTNLKVIETINKHFVPIKFNPEKSEVYIIGNDTLSGRQLLATLSGNKPSGYPTTYFFVPGKNTVFQQPGYIEPEQFAGILESMIAKSKE
jgi:uncharacterized protein YyaL (SSP411 family)